MAVKDYVSTQTFQQVDPQDFANAIGLMRAAKQITYQSATLTVVTVPANSIIHGVRFVRTTAWDAITTAEVGKAGDTDWLSTTAQANLIGAIGAGEQGEMEVITTGKVVTADTDIILTLDQGAASAGVGWVVVEFSELRGTL